MLIKAINRHLRDRPKADRPRRCFHPSSLYRPESELYRMYLEGDNNEEHDPRTLRIFENGNSVHERLQHYLKAAGVLLESEVPVYHEELEIRGHADGIIEAFGKRAVLEIKSIASRPFYALEAPLRQHLVQVHAYMIASGLPRGAVLYECKNTQELKEFFLIENPEMRDEIIGKIKAVQKRLRENGHA